MTTELNDRKEQVKDMDIVSWLAANGHQPAKKSGRNLFYYSPFHAERTPSFSVNTQGNYWKDFSTGEGGDLIELVKKIRGCSFQAAVDLLSQDAGIEIPKFEKPDVPEKADPFNITWVGELFSDDLTTYIESRGIPVELAKKYCQEVWFNLWSENNQRWYSMKCLGFKNDKGGWEFRNKDWKGGNSPKWYTTIKGANDVGTVNVFEGWIDFLSALVFYERDEFESDTIVMNSLSFFGRVSDVLKGYHTVNLFLDNDNAGKMYTDKFCRSFYCRDFSGIYQGHEDFNSKLTSR